jgi:alpha-tubulin suppressor-like RCC1 family protein
MLDCVKLRATTLLIPLFFFAACSHRSEDAPTAAAAMTETERLSAVHIVAGTNHTCAVLQDGNVRCWGANAMGASGRIRQEGGRGDRGAIGVAKFPGPILGVAAGTMSTCASVLADPFHASASLLLPDDGQVNAPNGVGAVVQLYCWGAPNVPTCNSGVSAPSGPDEGMPQQLCGVDGLTRPANAFTGTDARSAITAFAMSGVDQLCVGKLKTSETTKVDGSGVAVSAEQGDGLECFTGLTKRSFPELAGKTVTKVAMSPVHACAVADGALYCWGSNEFGQIGDGTKTDAAAPVRITALSGTVRDVAAGSGQTCAITTEGTFCVGSGGFGQLGDGMKSFTSQTWVKVVGLPDGGATSVAAAGIGRTCAIAAGDVYCWGENSFGRVGNGANGAPIVGAPVKLSGIQGKVSEIAIGDSHGCALTEAGVQCWGSNLDGQLGGAISATSSPDPVFVRAKPLVDTTPL